MMHNNLSPFVIAMILTFITFYPVVVGIAENDFPQFCRKENRMLQCHFQLLLLISYPIAPNNTFASNGTINPPFRIKRLRLQ